MNQIIELKHSGHQVDIFSRWRNDQRKIHPQLIESNLLQCVTYLDPIIGARKTKFKRLLRGILKGSRRHNYFQMVKAYLSKKSTLPFSEILHFIDKPSYDVLHAHFGVNGNYVTQLKNLGLFPASKFVTTFHGYDLHVSTLTEKIYEELFRTCKSYTVNSIHSEKRLIALGCTPKFIHRIPVGLEINYFKKDKNISSENILLYVGRLIPFKAPTLFVEICNELVKSQKVEFKAILIGEGILRDEVVNLINKYNLSDVVDMMGAKTQDEIKEFMNMANVFIMPGIEIDGNVETQGLVIQEAQAMELPVVVSNAGGMSEGMKDGITGFVVEEKNIIKFVEKVEILFKNRNTAKQMGAEGRRFVAEKYDIRLLNRKLLDVYIS